MDQQKLPPEGWYSDRTQPDRQRWWDGQQWTGATRPGEAPSASQQTGGGYGWILWGFVGVFALTFAGCMAMLSGGDDGPEGMGEGEARYVCEQYVKGRLKAPGTADFQRPTVSSLGNDQWRVAGSVDAENSFGGSVRQQYVCTVEDAGDGEATLVDLATD